jgi:hypothetical protein
MPGSEHRFPRSADMKLLGNTVDKELEHFEFSQIAAR